MMKKRISSLVLVLALAASFCVSAFAADASSTISYTGSELQVTNGDVNFADMLPGTSRSQEIILVNNSEKTADFYMDLQVLQALEDGGAQGALYDFALSITTDEGTNYVYGTDANGNTVGGEGSAGMYELNSDLDTLTASSEGSWMNVARLEPGKSATVNFSLSLDGTATANDYQDQLGQFGFQFRCSDTENTVITEERVENTVVTVINTVVRQVQTGDNAPIILLVTVMAVGVLLLVFLVVRRKKHKMEV